MADEVDSWQFLPWQPAQARPWLADRKRFAHAWLLHGAAGIGKVRFARAAAAALLCESPRDHLACGSCNACLWLRRGNHPDFRAIRPESVALSEGSVIETDDAPASGGAKKAPSREIRVEQIRAIETWVNTATHRGGLRVALLYPAQSLNTISANALLKVLEEPPAGTLFLLVCDSVDTLLPTLVSRCRRLPLAAPPRDQAMQWLRASGVAEPEGYLAAVGGSPLAAFEAFQSGREPTPAWLMEWVRACAAGRGPKQLGRLVDELEKTPAADWLDALQRVLADLMLLQAGAALRYYPSLQAPLAELARKLAPLPVAQAARWLATQQRVANHPLNPRLFIHSALLRVTAACS